MATIVLQGTYNKQNCSQVCIHILLCRFVCIHILLCRFVFAWCFFSEPTTYAWTVQFSNAQLALLNALFKLFWAENRDSHQIQYNIIRKRGQNLEIITKSLKFVPVYNSNNKVFGNMTINFFIKGRENVFHFSGYSLTRLEVEPSCWSSAAPA